MNEELKKQWYKKFELEKEHQQKESVVANESKTNMDISRRPNNQRNADVPFSIGSLRGPRETNCEVVGKL